MIRNKEYAYLRDLNKGDIFWFMYRGFIVRDKTEAGVQVECLDDGGTPVLNPDLYVEVVTRKTSGNV